MMRPEGGDRGNTRPLPSFRQKLHLASDARHGRLGISGGLSHFSGVQTSLLLYEVFWAEFQMLRASCLACLSSRGPRLNALRFVSASLFFFFHSLLNEKSTHPLSFLDSIKFQNQFKTKSSDPCSHGTVRPEQLGGSRSGETGQGRHRSFPRVIRRHTVMFGVDEMPEPTTG